MAHTIGHVAATVSMSKVAVSFTHIIKSGEPAFSVLVSRFLLGETFPVPVYLSLIPIIGGCALAALTELNFNMTGNRQIFLCRSWVLSHFIRFCMPVFNFFSLIFVTQVKFGWNNGGRVEKDLKCQVTYFIFSLVFCEFGTTMFSFPKA